MRRQVMVAAMLLLAGGLPAAAQGFSVPGLGGGSTGGSGAGAGSGGLGGALGSIPGLGQPETPEQKRAFCQRVAGAAARCGLGLDVTALSACLVRTLPAQDSMRVAQVANAARGSASSLLTECGIGFGR